MKSEVKLILLFALVNLITPALIYEKIPYYVQFARIKKDLQTIEERKIFQKHKFNDISKDIPDKYTLSLKEIYPKAHFLNTDLPTMTIIPFPFYNVTFKKESPTDPDMYVARYEALLSSSINSNTYKITFDITFEDYSLKLNFLRYEESYFYLYEASCKLTLGIKIHDYSTVGKEIQLEDIDVLLKQLLSDNNNDLLNDYYLKGIDSYYSNLYIEKVSLQFATNSAEGSFISHKLDLVRDKVPKVENENSILNYYSGAIDTDVQTGMTDLEIDHSKDGYFVYVHKSIFEDLLKKSKFTFLYKTPAIEDYELKIGDLSQVIKDLEADFPDPEAKIFVKNVISNIVFDEKDISAEGIKAKINMMSDIHLANDEFHILSYSWDLDLTLRFSYYKGGLNLVLLGKDIKVSNLVLQDIPKDRTFKNEPLLTNWMTLSLQLALSDNEYNLFKKAIDLRKYFDNNEEFSIGVEGNYFIFQGTAKI